MKAIFVEQPYANYITHNLKKWETRSKDVLGSLVGERVGIITKSKPSGKYDTLVGYATIKASAKVDAETLDMFRDWTCIPRGSKYDTGKARHVYIMQDASCIMPRFVNITKHHGRSWCEYETED